MQSSVFGINDVHQGHVVEYMQMIRTQRLRHLKAIEQCFAELKSSRLSDDDMYTVDEVVEMLDGLQQVVQADVESELLHVAHVNVLLVNQVFQQVEKNSVNVAIDIYQLENRELLEQVSEFEAKAFSEQPAEVTPPPPAAVDQKPPRKLEHLEVGSSSVVSLHMEIQQLKQENQQLKVQLEQANTKTSPPSSDAESQPPAEKLEFAKEVEASKKELERITQLLKATETELEKKVSQTAPFKNLKRIVLSKNQQIKDLRTRLVELERSAGKNKQAELPETTQLAKDKTATEIVGEGMS